MASEFLFLEEVAAEIRTPLSTVRYWIITGKLPSIRPGRRRLVRRSDLERFLAASGGDSAAPASTPPSSSGGDSKT
jgi:excisionase family DNA binding protein